jgi:hypothetical protein
MINTVLSPCPGFAAVLVGRLSPSRQNPKPEGERGEGSSLSPNSPTDRPTGELGREKSELPLVGGEVLADCPSQPARAWLHPFM